MEDKVTKSVHDAAYEQKISELLTKAALAQEAALHYIREAKRLTKEWKTSCPVREHS